MKHAIFVIALFLATTASDCPLASPCGADDLDFRAVPAQLTLAVGDTASVRIERGSCHWANHLPDANVLWTIDSLRIATVDSISGIVIARAAGQATIAAHDAGNEVAAVIPLSVR